MTDLSIFTRINDNVDSLEIDEIAELLQPLSKGMMVTAPVFQQGAYLYRARRIDAGFNKERGISVSDLSYPPVGKSKLGRVNRAGEPMFYCATSKEVIYYELQGLNKGDEIILSYWKTTDRLFFNSVGYTQAVLDSLGAKRNNPFSALEGDAFKGHQKITFNPNALTDEALKEVYSKDENSDVRQAFSQAFVQDVSDKHDHQYKLSTAIGKLHFGSINGGEFEISGIMYPTTRMWGNGDNIAIKPFAVDDSLQITMATHVRIDDRSDTSFSITAIDSAISFDKDGKLNWLGRLPNWTLHNQGDGVTVTLTAGRDKYGEYSYNKDGIASYWDVRDMRTGEIVESS